MTKAELIERYGIEWYEARKAKVREHSRAYMRDRYQNDPEWYEAHKANMKERYINNLNTRIARSRSYCKAGEFELIENYNLAKADNFKGWDVHHRDEIRTLHSGMVVYRSKQELIENGRYYDCPANELIFLRHDEHAKLHKFWLLTEI